MKETLLIGAALLLGAMAPVRAEILVGFVTGLSGPVSSIGVPNAKGLAAGQAYVGEIDGEKVRVIQLDDGSDPAASTRNARKLVEQEKVDFLIGTSGAPQTLAMATAAIEMKVPMVAVSPIAPVPAGEGGPWVVQTPQPTPLLVQGIVDHMKSRNVKTVAFIGFSDAFGDLMYNSLLQAAEKAGHQGDRERTLCAFRQFSHRAGAARDLRAARCDHAGRNRNARRAARDRAGRAWLQGPALWQSRHDQRGFPAACRQIGRRHHLPDRAGDGGRTASREQSDPQGRSRIPRGL